MEEAAEDDVVILEGMGLKVGMEEIALSSIRRRSARYLGKDRPNYALEKHPGSDEEEKVRRRTKRAPRKAPAKIFQTPLPQPVGSTIEVEVALGCDSGNGGDKMNLVDCLGEGHLTVDESGEAPAPLMQMAYKKRKVLMGGSALVFDDSRQDGLHSGVEKSARQIVKETLRLFNSYYLESVQEEEKRSKEIEAKLAEISKCKNGAARTDDLKRASKRPDLKAISKMQKEGKTLYQSKRIGDLPGIEVGDQFYSRAELVVVGLHGHWLKGIDFMGKAYADMEENKKYLLPLAVCILLSGMYEDDLDKSEEIIYTGQGGHDLNGSKRQNADQKMVSGNLALKNSYLTGAPVRVIRGHTSKSSYCGKVYTYDGLYKVIDQWAEKGQSEFTVFKYKLKRVAGQPALTTNQVFFSRAQAPQSISELRGLVAKDISGGQENLPIPATNVFDDPPFAPTDFEYCKSIKDPKNLKMPPDAVGCNCEGVCVDPRICSCAKLNGGDFPYVRKDGGRLIKAKPVVFECGPNCSCNNACVNRTSQQGLKYRLEVFRTARKGWAVRSWDSIPSGAPICEYTGLLSRSDDVDTVSENNYIFDIDCLQTIEGQGGREKRPGDETVLSVLVDKMSKVDYSIDAGYVGNIARFINHSCEPNLFVQCILSEHQDIKMAKVMLFAADTIPPLQELSYDYGYVIGSVFGKDGNVISRPCYCGAAACRKRLY